MIFVPRNLVSCFSQYLLSDSCAGPAGPQHSARAGMSRGNGKEQMNPAEKEGDDQESPQKRLLQRATVANPSVLVANPLCTVHHSQAISTKIDQIWNAFVLILLTRIWTGSALLSTGFTPMSGGLASSVARQGLREHDSSCTMHRDLQFLVTQHCKPR